MTTYLLICFEFQHILKLSVNMSRTKEIVFHQPSPRNYLPPAEILGIERVIIAKLLGVWLQPDLGTRKHIEYIIQICNQRFYLLSQMKKARFPAKTAAFMFEAIIVSRM